MKRIDRHRDVARHAFIMAVLGTFPFIAPAQCPGMEPSFIWSSVGTSVRFVNVTETWGVPVDSLLWDFGDGAGITSAGDTAYHTYGLTFVDTVRMALWSQGCSFTATAPVAHGDANDDCTLDLAPDFLATPAGNNTVSFTNASYTGGVAFSSVWSFGDDSLSLGAAPAHVFIFPGPYDVALNLAGEDTSTGDGCIAGKVWRLFVDGNSSTCDTSLFVDFTYFFDGSFAQFDAVIVPLSPGLDTTGFAWSLGDAGLSIANEQSPYHVYSYPGIYQVCLTVTATHDGDTLDTCSAMVCHTLEPTLTPVMETTPPTRLQAFPNPSAGTFAIRDARLTGEIVVELYDSAGQVLDRRRMRAAGVLEVDGGRLVPGTYVLRVNVDGSAMFSLLVKL